MRVDPLGKAIELLWSGCPSAAIDELATHPPAARRLALHADALRDLGAHT
ncbi:hypothetical protein [Galactobacter valiniphilus]|nr:hypothetical protein [Galactobacter valiniphilus]